jgi:hypothetical protein
MPAFAVFPEFFPDFPVVETEAATRVVLGHC